MDDLKNFGLAGAVIAVACVGITAAFRWASNTLLRQMENRENDLVWFRSAMDAKRSEGLASLERAQQEFTTALGRIEDTFTVAVQSICDRLEDIEQKIK